MTPTQFNEIVQQFVREAVDVDEWWMSSGPRRSPEKASFDMDILESLLAELKEEKHCRDFRRVEHHADRLLADQGIDLDRDDPEYRRLLLHLTEASIETLQRRIDRELSRILERSPRLSRGNRLRVPQLQASDFQMS